MLQNESSAVAVRLVVRARLVYRPLPGAENHAWYLVDVPGDAVAMYLGDTVTQALEALRQRNEMRHALDMPEIVVD